MYGRTLTGVRSDKRCQGTPVPQKPYRTRLPAGHAGSPPAAPAFGRSHVDLSSPADERLVEIQSLSDDGTAARVNFSRVYGHHATFFFSDDGVERYGENAHDYEPVNFFGE